MGTQLKRCYLWQQQHKGGGTELYIKEKLLYNIKTKLLLIWTRLLWINMLIVTPRAITKKIMKRCTVKEMRNESYVTWENL